VLYNSEDGYSRMFAYDNEVYKVISSSAIFAAFKDGDSLSMKPYLMAEIVNYFLGISPITDIKQLLSNNKGLDIVCHPNPFTESIQIDLKLENEADVNIRVFDELGRMINTVANSKLSSGSHTMKWNAVYGSGEMVETGIYFIHSTINGKVYTEKVLLTR
nr:T9SS type A sorting domain-containing protein [Bacteroidota bacterium]